MASRKRIVLTGGGTAGHVMPHLALLAGLRTQGWDCLYIGSSGIERDIITAQGVTFFTIQTGKLRRYFSWQNFFDLFRVAFGSLQSLLILIRHRPRLIFSKGGFVSVPVCLAGWLLRIPVVTHESDLSPGLANRIIAKFAKHILYSFPETEQFLRGYPTKCVGGLMRSELLSGDTDTGLRLCGFSSDRPTILVMGGSLGAVTINTVLEQALPDLVLDYNVVHLTGRGKAISFEHPHYKAFEFVGEEMAHLYAAASYIVARAGANSLFEFLYLRKPTLLIPLEGQASRGDQVENAHVFVKRGWAHLLREKDLNKRSLVDSLENLKVAAGSLQRSMAAVPVNQGLVEVESLLNGF